MPDDIYTQGMHRKWMSYWEEHRIFRFDENDRHKQLFVIDTPPPFTNGNLHMGQIFWVCYIDAIARYKKLKGFNVLYPQGWDTHGFPTEIAVENKYGKLQRDEFYKRCVELSTSNINGMRDKMLQLGSTFDDHYEYTTTSKDYVARVQYSMLLMHEKGMVYIGSHPVEWCTRCSSGVSREEAEEKEEETDLVHIKFDIAGAQPGQRSITIATTRPELLHACVAVAVNPNDERYKGIIGKRAETPLFGKKVNVIADEIVDKDYGTGAEMVCTFGDRRDILLYYKHKLHLVESVDKDGKLTNAGQFTGQGITEARANVISALNQDGRVSKAERIKHIIKVHDRDSSPLELLSLKQWFVKTKERAEAIKSTAKEIKWIPESSAHRLDDWANFIEWDWNISRDRVFGTPIPFWRCAKCDHIVAPSKDELPIDTSKAKPPTPKCPECGGKVVGTEETLDVWIDSSITPLIISGWPNNKELHSRAFPASVRIQGTDIVRTWAFYTMFRTAAITGDKPFESIIVHNMILGSDGREMHKRFGNGIALEDLVPKYPVDAVRLWVALSGAIGKDKVFSYKELDYAKSFLTKLYNTAKFVQAAMSEGKLPKSEPHDDFNAFDFWILSRLNQTIKEMTEGYDGMILYAAISKAVNFYWHEFADYYIENVKHRVYSDSKNMQRSKGAALFTLRYVLEASLRMFAPVIPFTCEEIHQMFDKGSLFEKPFPEYKERPEPTDYILNGLVFSSVRVQADPESLGAVLNDIISQVRKAKATQKLALNKEIASININVPGEYYSAVVASQDELKLILKARSIKVRKGEELTASITA
ncbi:MAG: valine--tRNA ligase [Candidatus Marsarchaeota archaeon]|nr:valine--tRNA ligase [Candidatus Marsarchaeota archaeon]MCL5112041.1 valine--tRNA ligase [Candidatus Marsarchaeota archaeon]